MKAEYIIYIKSAVALVSESDQDRTAAVRRRINYNYTLQGILMATISHKRHTSRAQESLFYQFNFPLDTKRTNDLHLDFYPSPGV